MWELPFTTMAVKEALRLYPPAHSLARIATADDVVDGFQVPAGSTVFVSPWVTHRREDLWPDPLRFDPLRFDPDVAPNRHRYAYFPFGGGPLGCISSHFALTEAVVATSLVVSACHVHTDGEIVPLTTGVTLRPAAAVPCQVTSRRRS